ncbi:Major facilitator superfamily domain general substrate transporter protein [Colletotrichum asianum]
MAVDIRFYQSLLGVYLFFIARIQAASDGSNTPEEKMAGWREGPNSRGTLNIVWSCGITIFACTWTVTHLNLPAPNDTAIRKFIRRLKWMSINIMFPEFILSKAICDLRQALDELRQFGQTLPSITDSTTWSARLGTLRSGERTSQILVDRMRYWEVEYPPCYKILYRLLGLKVPEPSDVERGDSGSSGLIKKGSVTQHGDPSSSTSGVANAKPTGSIEMQDLSRPNDNSSNAKSPAPEAPQSQHDANSPTGDHLRSEPFVENAPQKWTISHSYYAQMGGIMIPSDYTSDTVRYEVLTATKLTPQYQWDEDHPLKRLELSEQDIQDKSKADWLLKSLAILQIVWLVLNVIVRGVTGLAVTQLEIATAAFALMAVLTYVASWWKPKDISEPTYTRHSSTGV